MKKTNKLTKLTLTALLTLPMLAGCSSQTLKTVDNLEVEYGTPISTEVSDYLSEDIDKEDKDKILTQTKVEILEDKKVEGKEYQALGEYIVKLTYSDEVSEVKVIVKDTVKPVFKDFKKEVSYVKDCKPSAEDLVKQFKAEDLDKVTITVDDSKVNYTKEGNYKAVVKATDSSGNEATQEVTVKITKPEIKLDKTSKNLYVKESFVLKADIKGKDTKAAFKSSNTSVATVSETGKVVAKKKGSATITAEANGVKATCKVTVKSVPRGSKTTTKTVTNPTTGKKEEVVVVKPSKPTSASATTSREVFDLLNKERAKNGVPALKWSNSLGSLAKIRAKECLTKFSHTRPNGQSALNSLNIDGEILTGGTSSSDAVRRWMNSAGHRHGILKSDFTQCGVAKIKGADGYNDDIYVAIFRY